jgi:ParB family transcriptional regulator, chromosome partitioning protein
MSKTMNKKIKPNRLGRGLNSLLGNPSEELDVRPAREAVDLKEIKKKNLLKEKAKTIIIEEKKEKAEPVLVVQKINELEKIHQIFVENLSPNKNQPRKVFIDEALKELSESIKEKGIMQPIVAQRIDDKNFEIIAGERRWRAAQMAGLKAVPVILRVTDEKDSLELALIENIQRNNLNSMEEAEAYQILVDKYEMTQADIAQKVGKERATIANTLRLLKLSKEVQEYVSQQKLSMGHARALVAVEDLELQRKLAKKCIDLTLSVRAAERLVKNALEGKPEDAQNESAEQKAVKNLALEIQRITGSRAKIAYKNGRGALTLQFYSKDQFEGLIKKLRAWN